MSTSMDSLTSEEIAASAKHEYALLNIVRLDVLRDGAHKAWINADRAVGLRHGDEALIEIAQAAHEVYAEAAKNHAGAVAKLYTMMTA